MGAHVLERLFNPRSVAVFGASERPNALGTMVLANLIEAGFEGRIVPINPKHDKVRDLDCYPSLVEYGAPVDLAVVATPAATVPAIIRQCGEQGVKGAVVLSAGFGEAGATGKALQRDMMDAAQRHGMRIIGPNCLGIMRPSLGLNATFSRNQAKAGHLALVSQSGALCTAVLDWAEGRDVGLSAMASSGDAADVDFGELLDYLALDPKTRGILLYIEGVRDARRFLSGLRAAARVKPVIVLKSARHAEGSRAAATHTGALIGGDDVFNAALERAGVVRVDTVTQLFAAAQILSLGLRQKGENLLILTNGGGPGVMATDRAADLSVPLATLAPESLKALDAFLPAHWSHGNPVDILGDAEPERYEKALAVCLKDRNVHSVVVMLTPQAMTDPTGCAEAVIRVAKDSSKPVMACWMGETLVNEARTRFDEVGIPQFRAPESAVEAIAALLAHRRNQALLMQTPAAMPREAPADVAGARLIIEAARAEGRKILDMRESKAILSAFRIPTNASILARSPNEAMLAAETLGFPVALKISAPDLSHKSDSGGVRLNIRSAQSVRQQAAEMLDQIRTQHPDLRVDGVTVEHMSDRHNARELLVGILRDPVFGPVITFGMGGTAVEIMRDRALALPPLNATIIERMIEQTRVSRELGAFRGMPPVRREAIVDVLLRISEMACELPEIGGMDINPLFANDEGVMAVDARIELAPPVHGAEPYAHLAIHPYPAHLAETWAAPNGRIVHIRPIRPEDAEAEQAFVRSLSEESRLYRFMRPLEELTPEMLVRFTQIDYDREMAFVAVVEDTQTGRDLEIGVARYAIQPDGRSAEFAVVISDDWQGQGLGSHLLDVLMASARHRGIHELEGEVLSDNHSMLALAERMGFTRYPIEEDDSVVRVHRRL
ncbi:MAG: GNAT family N-acetyltransferase [Halothiobacillaceae bacterium]